MPSHLNNLCSDTYLIVIDLKNYKVSFFGLPTHSTNYSIDVSFNYHAVTRQFTITAAEIIDRYDNWSQLFLFLEAFYIKNLKPTVNEGLKPPAN